MSGNSDSGGLDDPTFTGELNLDGNAGPPVSQFEPEVAGGEELPPLTDYGQRFVEQVPEEERVYADKWVREWDAGVAKLRQKHEAEVAEYTQLGTQQDIRAGVQLFKMLTGSPDQQQEIADYLAENGVTAKQFADAIKADRERKVEAGEIDPTAERIEKLERALVTTAQQQQAAIQEQQTRAQQDAYIAALNDAESRLGKFDRQYVSYLLSMGQAQTLDEAVTAYHKLVPGQRKQAPRLLGSNGSAPAPRGGKKLDFGSMSEKDVGKYLVAKLEQERSLDYGG